MCATGHYPKLCPKKTEFSKILKTVLRRLNFEPFGENRMSIAFFVEEEQVFTHTDTQTDRHPYFINIYRLGLRPSTETLRASREVSHPDGQSPSCEDRAITRSIRSYLNYFLFFFTEVKIVRASTSTETLHYTRREKPRPPTPPSFIIAYFIYMYILIYNLMISYKKNVRGQFNEFMKQLHFNDFIATNEFMKHSCTLTTSLRRQIKTNR